MLQYVFNNQSFDKLLMNYLLLLLSLWSYFLRGTFKLRKQCLQWIVCVYCTVREEAKNTRLCQWFINKVRSPQTKFATHGWAGVMVIRFVFWWVKYDVWASAFQMSLHWSQGPISLGKGNHFLFRLLSYEMEEGAAEVGERARWILRWLLRNGRQTKG